MKNLKTLQIRNCQKMNFIIQSKTRLKRKKKKKKLEKRNDKNSKE